MESVVLYMGTCLKKTAFVEDTSVRVCTGSPVFPYTRLCVSV